MNLMLLGVRRAASDAAVHFVSGNPGCPIFGGQQPLDHLPGEVRLDQKRGLFGKARGRQG